MSSDYDDELHPWRTFLFDILRWLLASMIMLVLIFYSVIYALQGVEYYLFFTSKFHLFMYLFAWGLALAMFLPIFTFLTAMAIYFVMLIVRQKLAFGNIIGTIYLLGIAVLLVSYWTSWIQFGWEAMLQHHHTLDKWAFSFFWLGMLGIPKKIASNYQQYIERGYN